MRTFIAIDIPEDVKTSLANLQADLKQIGADAAWTNPAGMHLTLKFLGEVSESLIPEIEKSCMAAVSAIEQLTMTLNGTGVFPNFRNPRVLWAGIKEETGRLLELQRRLEVELRSQGFRPEDKPFNPHLTLCRIKSPRNSRELIARAEMYDLPEISFGVMDIRLYKSELSPAGSKYTELYRCHFR